MYIKNIFKIKQKNCLCYSGKLPLPTTSQKGKRIISEEKPLRDLSMTSSIVIIEAEKRGVVVIGKKEFYKEKKFHACYRARHFNREIDRDYDRNTIQKIKNII